MTAKTTATRAEAIAAAVSRYAGDDFLMFWDQSEYIEGVCQTIADTFGVNDEGNARSEVWEEMRAAFEHGKRRAAAERIAAEQIEIDYSAAQRTWDYLPNDARRDDLKTALTMAALAGMEQS